MKKAVVLGSYAPSLLNFRGPLIKKLGESGYQVIAMAPRIDEDVAAELRAIGAVPHEVQITNNSLNPFGTLKSLAELRKQFRAIAPDVVIAYTIKPVTLGSIAAASARVPQIVALITGLGFAFTPGGGIKRRLGRAVATFLYRCAMRRATTVLFQNHDDLRFFQDNRILVGKGAAVTDGSGIDLEAFKPAPLPVEPRFLMIARLIVDKGVREYAAAAMMLKKHYPSARFELAGWFDDSPNAISRAELESWAGAVDYLGKLADVRPAIARASVYVLPSRYREGVPRSSLEAMAMGRPIVTTDSVGCRETVEPGRNGFLVEPLNAEALAEAMERFITAPELMHRMGAESRRLAETRFDVNLVNKQIIEAAGL